MGRVLPLGYDVVARHLVVKELRHKELWHPGEHPAIIAPALWAAVHAILSINSHVRSGMNREGTPFLLKGMVFGHDGRALTHYHSTKKNGRRYRYYITQREIAEHAGASGLPRMPAAELESAVLEQLRGLLRSPDLLAEMVPIALKLDPTLDEAKVSVGMSQLDAVWDQLFPAEQTRIVKLLVEKVTLSPNNLEVRLRANGLAQLMREMHPAADQATAVNEAAEATA